MRTLTDDDAIRAGAVLARAFDDDPAFRWWYPEPDERRDWLPGFFAAQVRLALLLGDALGSDEGDAVALSLPPGATIDADAIGRAGVGAAIAGAGPDRAPQIGLFLETLGALHAGAAPEPHWQLFFLGVEPASHGRGQGSALVEEMTARAGRDGVPCYLDTITAPNVAFYERRGYRVAAEADVPDSPLHAWGMRVDAP